MSGRGEKAGFGPARGVFRLGTVAALLTGWLAALGAPGGPAAAQQQPAVRIKDLARLEGLRPNQLVGLGLVVGLPRTGDGPGSTHLQMVANMLEHFGVAVDSGSLRLRNAAAVMVTATLPPLARPGDRVDVTVSSLGDARSLAGGVLLQTPLQGADGQVYAVAQGSLVAGLGAGKQTFGRPQATVALVPRGAIVERAVPAPVLQGGAVRLVLHWPDFSTAAKVVETINVALGEPAASTRDGAVVVVRPPAAYRDDPVGLIAAIENLAVIPEAAGRVMISERTGTVVIGHQVRIAPVAVASGGIRVQVGSPSQPPPPPSAGRREQPVGQMAMLSASATVAELVEALNLLGASPRDVVNLLQAIQAAGALYGQLEVM